MSFHPADHQYQILYSKSPLLIFYSSLKFKTSSPQTSWTHFTWIENMQRRVLTKPNSLFHP